MENGKASSDRRPVTLLIISGFVFAALSVIAMAILAYTQVTVLSDQIINPGKAAKYQTFLDSLYIDYDRASLSARYMVMYGNEKDATVWNKLDSRKQQLTSLDLLEDMLPEKERGLFANLKINFLSRYQTLKSIRNLSNMVNPPDVESMDFPISRSEYIKVDTLFQALQMDGTDVVVIDWQDLWPDSSSYEVIFPTLLNYLKDNALRSQQLTALVKEDQRLIYSANLIRTRLDRILRGKKMEGYTGADETAGRVRKYIGFSSVLIIVFCIILLIKIVRDIERNRLLEEELRQAKLQAEELARAKEEFLANMSHEMRTPMNAVIGFSSQLTETSLNSHQQSLLQPIRHSADFLLALINDILDYSKLEAGKFSLAKEHFRLRKVVQEVGQLFVPKAESKGIELIVDMADNVPEVVMGDEMRLKQMLMNLGGNAVKFTDRGSVRICVSSVRKEAQPHKVLFEVTDTGIGIPSDQLNRIFKDFIQVDGSNSRRYGGTGLGLSITKKLCELHGGEIHLESKEGKGTKVQLLLSYEAGNVSEIEEQIDKPVNVHPELAGKRVLLADDEPYNRMLVRGLLESWKMEVTSATNGREVLEAMAPPELYSVLLMDLQMPELDGIETSLKIREEFSTAIPILALTATSSPREQQKALDAGMQGVMLKPFKAQELHDTLLSLMKIQATKEQSSILHMPTESPENPFPELYKATRGDERMMNKMLQQYLNLTDSNQEKLLKAYEGKDAKNLALIAHRMIPANRHLGFQNIVQHLKRVEELGEKELFTQELDQLLADLKLWFVGSKEKVRKVLEKVDPA